MKSNLILIVFLILMMSAAEAFSQSRVTYSVTNRSISAGVYYAEISATVNSSSNPWTVGPTSVIVHYNSSALDPSLFNGSSVLNFDSQLTSSGYVCNQSQYSSNSIQMVIITFNSNVSKTGTFVLGTLRWTITNASAFDNLTFSTSDMEVYQNLTLLNYNCPAATCFTITDPVSQTIQPSAPYQNINLNNGWNLISSYANPTNINTDTIFSDIISSNKLVVAEDESGGIKFPLTGFNTLINWNFHKSYWLYSIGSNVLKINGSLLNPQTTPISLHTGWNYVAYLRTSAMSVVQALASIDTALLVVKNGNHEAYYPAGGINTLEQGTTNAGMMLPGKGYLIYATKPATLTYPGN
jgi:hypothetical protein